MRKPLRRRAETHGALPHHGYTGAMSMPGTTAASSTLPSGGCARAPGATRVYLVRHGEIDAAWHGRIDGSLDVPLSERGRHEGARVARTLAEVALAAVVSSGLARTEQLAAELRAPRGLARIDDPALAEIDRGQWAGLSLVELEARAPG